ncbi:MAG: hypothetical protein HFJ84_01345 [Clostridiales bacterium]|nr:hypothetical protein [Clostridiales bacterium]
MKKMVFITSILMMIVTLFACGSNHTYEIGITIPAGSTETFVYSREEISPTKDTIIISSGEGLGDTEVVLKTIEATEENTYEPTYLTPGMPVEMEVEKGAWFQVGVSIQNPTGKDIKLTVVIENIDVRME